VVAVSWCRSFRSDGHEACDSAGQVIGSRRFREYRKGAGRERPDGKVWLAVEIPCQPFRRLLGQASEVRNAATNDDRSACSLKELAGRARSPANDSRMACTDD
jgi:hypothetical protein